MEPESALIRTYSTVKLNAETSVYTHLSSVINPWNTEHYNTFRFNNALQNSILFYFGHFFNNRFK